MGEYWIKRLLLSLIHIPVTLIETTDYYRLVQLMRNARVFSKYFNGDIYLIMLQTSRLYRLDAYENDVSLSEVSEDGNNVLGIGNNPIRNVISELDEDSKPIISRRVEEGNKLNNLYIMYSVRDASRVRELSDRVYYWAQALNRNRLIIFTTDMGLWDDVIRKMCTQIYIVPSSVKERTTIINRIVEKYNEDQDSMREELNKIIEVSSGMDITQLKRIAESSIVRFGKLRYEVFLEEKKKLLTSYSLNLVDSNITFDDIGGYNSVKDYFRNWLSKAIMNPEKFKKYNLNPPKGVLLYGPPGTGKTMIAKALSRETGLPLIRISAGTFLSKYVGESEKTVEKVTRLLNSMGRTIVFIDEIDSIALVRESVGTGDTGTFLRVLSSLLTWLSDENRPSVVIGATNRPYSMDEAFIRYGRFDDLIPMLYPDEEARRKIIEIHLRGRYVDNSMKIPEDIIKGTELWTGAELAMLVDRAARRALMDDLPIKTEHIVLAYEDIKYKFDIKSRIEELKKYVQFTNMAPNANIEMLKGQITIDETGNISV